MSDNPDKITEGVIELALERFKETAMAEHDNRKKTKNDLQFYVGEDQWDAAIKSERAGDARPCLVINRLPQFVRQVTNDQRQNRPSLHIIPVGDSDKEVADIYEGLVRHIQEASNADIAYDTACQNQVIGGVGYFRVITDYCNEESFDQEILIKRIKNPLTVYVDPAACEPDYSDARYMFITSEIPHDEFRKLYPGKQIVSKDDFSGLGDEISPWATQHTMRVAEYFEIVEDGKEKIYLLEDGSVVTELPEGVEAVKEREVARKKVIWRMISGLEVLEEKEWPGKYIPIIPVLGDDVDVDGKRYLKGMVRDAKDPQRMYNYWASAQTEMIALAPKAPFIAAEGQIEGYKAIWESANRKNHAYLPYKPTTVNGTQVPAPQRQTAEPPVQAMVQAMAQASEDMKATTGIYDASLGARSNESSGRAINARKLQGDIANYHFIDNLSRSIRHLGRILIDLIPKIYDAPRIIRITGEDGSGLSIPVNQTVQMGGVEKIFDLTTGKYDVVVDVGPSYKTKREQAAENMTMILQSNPELWQTCGDIFAQNLDWPGANKLAERLKKMLPPQLQDENANIPPQVKAQLEQAQAMIEQMTEALNKLQDEREIKLMELESKEAIAAMNNQTAIVLEEIKNNFGAFQEEVKWLTNHFKREMQQEEAMEAQMQKQPIDNAESSATMGSM